LSQTVSSGGARRGQLGGARPGFLVAVVIVGLVGLLLLVPTRDAQERPLDVRERLHDFIEHGPGAGLWQLHTLDGTSEWLVADHPRDATCLLVARVQEGGRPGKVRIWEKHRLARFFLPGSLELFFRNYRLLEPTVLDDGGRPRVFAIWLPRTDLGGDTGRTVWIDQGTREVVRLEDRSYTGNCVRCLLRLSPDAPPLGVPALEAGDQCRRFPETERAPSAARLAGRVPFTVLEPTFLPEGFSLIAANYRELQVDCKGPNGEEEPPRCVGLAYLQYSDGLVNISIGIALPEDMDAFESWMASRPVEDDPDACPALPEEARPLTADGELIRRRRDRCRTVLRLDGRGEVSVLLLGRNEIPEDEYLHVIASVAPIQPGSTDRQPGADGTNR